MEFIEIFALALIQGLTEFLPISSSAHLIVLPLLVGWDDQGLVFDVAVHIGSLTAVVFYFRKTLKKLSIDWASSIKQRSMIGDSRLAWAILFGTIPVGLCGLMLGSLVEIHLRSPLVIAAATIFFGLVLGWADWRSKQERDEHHLCLFDILFIGLAQALALIPGTSRSGITITAGLLLGLTREAASRFSFLLSIPVIFLAGSLKTIELLQSEVIADWNALMSGTILSALSAYFCITIFLKIVEKIGMWPFVIYRLFIGAILLQLFMA